MRKVSAEDSMRETDESPAEEISTLTEKNVPTDKAKWSYYKSQAKKKFKVYPAHTPTHGRRRNIKPWVVAGEKVKSNAFLRSN